MLQQWLDPGITLVPLVIGLGVFALLAIILGVLRRAGLLVGLTSPYLIGAAALSVGIFLARALERLGRPLDATVAHVLLAIMLFCWGVVALSLVESLLLDRWTRDGTTAVPRLVRDIGRAIAFVVAVLMALQLLFNISPNSLVISSTVLSAVIGLALQDLLKNLIAGVALQLERPFDVGHWIQVGNDIGKVVEMSWRATRVITVDNNYVIYPNATLAQSDLINYTMPAPLQAMHVQIAVGYGHPPNQIKRILTESTLASPHVAPDPRPSIKLLAYGEYSVTYDIKFWLYSYDNFPDKRDSVMTNAWYALHRAGVKPPLPVRQIYTYEVDEQARAAERAAQVEQIVEDLRCADVLAALSEAELRRLAERATLRLYGAGDVLVRQGDPGDALFILRSGQVRVTVEGAADGRGAPGAVTVNELGPGDSFGELALLTGAARGATVTAVEDTEALIVARADLAPLMRASPALAERLGELLEQRVKMTQAMLASRRVGEQHVEDMSRPTLIGRIRQFFGISA